jgi:hypothetical protein
MLTIESDHLTFSFWSPVQGFEPATTDLQERCSTN